MKFIFSKIRLTARLGVDRVKSYVMYWGLGLNNRKKTIMAESVFYDAHGGWHTVSKHSIKTAFKLQSYSIMCTLNLFGINILMVTIPHTLTLFIPILSNTIIDL